MLKMKAIAFVHWLRKSWGDRSHDGAYFSLSWPTALSAFLVKHLTRKASRQPLIV